MRNGNRRPATGGHFFYLVEARRPFLGKQRGGTRESGCRYHELAAMHVYFQYDAAAHLPAPAGSNDPRF
jgi:hypothetical protein